MRYFLGVDGGGTKTESVLLDDSGTIVGRSRSGPSNQTRIGFDAAKEFLLAGVRDVLHSSGVKVPDVQVVCAGLAGTGMPENAARMQSTLAEAFPNASIHVITDLELALASVDGSGPAIVLVAGTGSAAIGRDAFGKVARTGGFGPKSSDEGSAFDIGRAAVQAILQETTETGHEPAIGPQVLRELAVADWGQVDAKIKQNPDEIYPNVFPVIALAADAGDALALRLLTNAACKLSALADELSVALSLTETSFVLAKTGGMIGRSVAFDTILDEQLRQALPLASLVQLSGNHAEVAARLALRYASSSRRMGH
jgi:N-acetylglucosamine kinase-like BadF-type ATPase